MYAAELLNWLQANLLFVLILLNTNCVLTRADTPCTHLADCLGVHHGRERHRLEKRALIKTIYHGEKLPPKNYMNLDPYEERLLIGLVCGSVGVVVVVVFGICCLRRYRVDRSSKNDWPKNAGMAMMGQPVYYPTGYPSGGGQVDPRLLDPMRAQSMQSGSGNYPQNMYPAGYGQQYQPQAVVNSDYANLSLPGKQSYREEGGQFVSAEQNV